MTPAALSDAQRFDWLRLIRCENVGPRTFQQLLNHFGGAGAALEALPALIAKGGAAKTIKLASVADIEKEMEASLALGVRFIARGEPDYPPQLRMIDTAPPVIAMRGRADIFVKAMVALVGSRNASAPGLAFTDRLARAIGREGHVVVSGLARGIDERAHRASLSTGTIAVMAGGHARIYPTEHEPLVEEILDKGAVISEMPIAWEPRGRDFPRRNRIVSGLALATVVVEAARRSGSLITAKFATEQGREVFAVPGSPLDPRAEGTNDLLRQGATICTRVEDVTDAVALMVRGEGGRNDLFARDEPRIDEVENLWDETDIFGEPKAQAYRVPASGGARVPASPRAPDPPTAPASPEETRKTIVNLLSPAPISVDELLRSVGRPVPEVQGLLLELELDGTLLRHGGNLVSLAVK